MSTELTGIIHIYNFLDVHLSLPNRNRMSYCNLWLKSSNLGIMQNDGYCLVLLQIATSYTLVNCATEIG